MYLPSAVTKQAEIEAAIARVQESIGPDVVRIRSGLSLFNLGTKLVR